MNISRGSVATCFSHSGIFSYCFTVLLLNLWKNLLSQSAFSKVVGKNVVAPVVRTWYSYSYDVVGLSSLIDWLSFTQRPCTHQLVAIFYMGRDSASCINVSSPIVLKEKLWRQIMRVFYTLDAHPVTHPTMLKHYMECKHWPRSGKITRWLRAFVIHQLTPAGVILCVASTKTVYFVYLHEVWIILVGAVILLILWNFVLFGDFLLHSWHVVCVLWSILFRA